MQFPAKDISEVLASGMTKEDIVKQPTSLESEDVNAALLYKAQCAFVAPLAFIQHNLNKKNFMNDLLQQITTKSWLCDSNHY